MIHYIATLNIHMDDDYREIEDEADDIIAQIKNQSKILKNPEKERPDIKKEDLEDFIIKNAANVVQDSSDMVERMKIEVMAGATSDLIEATSELVRATTSAIDSLIKLKTADDKINSQKELTEMNIEARKNNDDSTPSGMLLSREEILKALTDRREEPKVIDVD